VFLKKTQERFQKFRQKLKTEIMKKIILVLIIFLSLYKVEAQEEKGFSFGYSLFAAETFFSPMWELNIKVFSLEINTMAQINMNGEGLYLSKGLGITNYCFNAEEGWKIYLSSYYIWNLLSHPYWSVEKDKYIYPISDAIIISVGGEFPFSLEDAIKRITLNPRELCPKIMEGKILYLTLAFGGDYFVDKKSIFPFVKIGFKSYI
jgi:hypothetical protein